MLPSTNLSIALLIILIAWSESFSLSPRSGAFISTKKTSASDHLPRSLLPSNPLLATSLNYKIDEKIWQKIETQNIDEEEDMFWDVTGTHEKIEDESLPTSKVSLPVIGQRK